MSWPVRLPLLLFVACFIACLVAYAAIKTPGPWFPKADLQTWTPEQMAVSRGQAVASAGALSVMPDAFGTIIVATTSSLRSSDYPVIAWSAADVPKDAEARLLWRNEYRPEKLNARRLTVSSGQLLPATVNGDPDWIGNITGLALAIQPHSTQPVRILGLAAKPTGVMAVLRDCVSDWIVFEPWSGTSINTLSGGADAQPLPLPALLACSAILAGVVWFAMARRRKLLSGVPVMIATVFLVGWAISDARWTWNLVRQSRATTAQFGGKDAHERRLANDDGPLYAFIERVRAVLPEPPARVFMAADDDYFRDRGAYHLYPHNVYYEPHANTLPPPTSMRPDDYVVVFFRHNIQYDAASQRLRWDGYPPIAAALVLIEPNGGVFRIR